MIFTTKPLKTSLINAAHPIEFFLQRANSLEVISREVCFIRYIGMDDDEAAYLKLIKTIDNHYSEKEKQTPYLRLSHFDTITKIDELNALAKQYDAWNEIKDIPSKEAMFQFKFPVKLPNTTLEWTQKIALQKVLRTYEMNTPFVTPSMIRNFGIKIFGWMTLYFPRLFGAGATMNHFPKIIFVGQIKRQECLFLYFLSLLGCDILYMNCAEDICSSYTEAMVFSTLYQCKNHCKSDLHIPELLSEQRRVAPVVPPFANGAAAASSSVNQQHSSINLNRPGRLNAKKIAATSAPDLSYEELAKRSASVVMIKVCDDDQKFFKTGSGVVINNSGYILTNFHVVCGGSGFAVQFENEEQEHLTQTLVKYHSDYDLAVIKVGKACAPLSLCKGTGLVRGQKIVAIGSPLGLFNTVSDGIISGFRKMEKKSMIQFTAPISSGSSGGALIDMQGNLVGLITAGFDDGQNLNLAVDHQTIYAFIQSFI